MHFTSGKKGIYDSTSWEILAKRTVGIIREENHNLFQNYGNNPIHTQQENLHLLNLEVVDEITDYFNSFMKEINLLYQQKKDKISELEATNSTFHDSTTTNKVFFYCINMTLRNELFRIVRTIEWIVLA